MPRSLRAKLLLMLSVLALGFGVLMGVSTLVEREVERDLALIQERFIPLLALGPKLEQRFERLRRGLQDAVAAQDAEALEETRALEAALLRTLAEGASALPKGEARALASAVEDYYARAFDVSRRLLSAESGQQLRADMRAMQSKHAQVLARLRSASALDSAALTRAFVEASAAQRTATRVRFVVTLGCLGVVLILSSLISRGLLRALGQLGAGFARFGRGDFSVLIPEQGDQELLQLARQANHMAVSLERIGRERERQQERLAQMNAELSARSSELEMQHKNLALKNSELSDARKRLEQKAHELLTVSSYKSQFLANMSHELRTPLNSMLVLSGLLAENESGNLSARQVEYCRTIHDAGTDLLALINQVLDLAKIESGKQDVHVSEIALRDVADYARRIFEPLARDKKLAFEVSIDDGLPSHIQSDRRRIEQILNNLLGNAIKFTEHGHVRLRFTKRRAAAAADKAGADRLAIEIEDTGAGIPSEHQGRIFGAFEQLDGAVDRRYGGTGLGLSIARELAHLLGGEIELRSEPGRGSVFACVLPVVFEAQLAKLQRPSAGQLPATAHAASESEVMENAEAAQRALPADLLEGAMILVVEDDMRTLYALSALLHAKGAEVLSSDTPQSVPEELERHPQLSAVVMSITTPEQVAFEALRQIRAQARFAHLPVIALSERTRDEERDECLRRGASAHLAKPIDAEHLCLLLHSSINDPMLPRAAARG